MEYSSDFCWLVENEPAPGRYRSSACGYLNVWICVCGLELHDGTVPPCWSTSPLCQVTKGKLFSCSVCVFVRRLQLLVCEQCPALIWFFWQLELSYAGWGPLCVWFQSCAASLCRLVYFCAPNHCPVYDICIKSPVKWRLWEKVLFSKLAVYIDSVKHYRNVHDLERRARARSPRTHTHTSIDGWKHLRAPISNLRHQIKCRNEKMHQNNDGNGFHLGASKGEWGTSSVRHSYSTNNRSRMSYRINKCVCSIHACFNLPTAAGEELVHIQSKEGLRLKYHNKNEFPEMAAAVF